VQSLVAARATAAGGARAWRASEIHADFLK
jgi:hypothetical protein